MHSLYRSYNARPLPRPVKPPRRRLVPVLIIIAVLAAAYIAYCLLRPLPAPKIVITPPVQPALVTVAIPWPASAAGEQAAYGADGYGLLAASNPQAAPTPMASVNKVITALLILQKKPLKIGESGPLITASPADADLYNSYLAKDGSAVPVAVGQKFSQYQALQALMLPSANNIADSLAAWAYGDMAGYLTAANQYVRGLGMSQTTVADASGFSPASTSTAADLVRLGDAALDNPVLAEIVNQPSAEFPGYGTIRNVNILLGQSGIRGIKTGNTDEAGGCFLGTADVMVGGKTVKVITAVMAAPNLGSALRDTLPLVRSSPSQFQSVHVVRAGQTVGRAMTAWGSASAITARQDISVTAWNGTTIPALKTKISDQRSSDKIGDMSLQFQGKTQTAEVYVKDRLASPGWRWRVSHPL